MTTSKPLAGLRVAISVSDVPREELETRGLSESDVNRVFLELARRLLGLGATLVYGGDLRLRGFTRQLFDLARSVDPAERPAADRIVNFLAQPIFDKAAPADRDAFQDAATLVRVPAPAVLQDRGIAESEPLYFARCLTEMRERMNERTDARVFLGAKSVNYLGRYPGVLEEAELALRAGQPIYLLGGFGGCTHLMSRVVQSEQPVELTTEYQQQHTKGYADLLAQYEAKLGERVDFAGPVQALRAGLRNGLSVEQNAELFASVDVDQVVALVVEGLAKQRAQ